jgi:hypothetical protein
MRNRLSQCSDLLGAKGIELPASAGLLLNQQLAPPLELALRIREEEKRLESLMVASPALDQVPSMRLRRLSCAHIELPSAFHVA